MSRVVTILLVLCALVPLAGCQQGPRNQFIHWVARDAWDPGCAHAAIIEKWQDNNRQWAERYTRYTLDVDATFKLVNPCATGKNGKTYQQFETVSFKVSQLEMVKCETSDGTEGWSTPGGRCLTGPNPPLVP
jgi:hypothetical protein